MKKIVLIALMMLTVIMMFACKDKDEEIVYNKEEGVASGTVELSGKEPKISISNIKAKKGTDIDYLSGVIIEDEDQYEDLKVWVDASAVDIYEPGNYKAKYTFEYDGKSITHEIVVTIIDEQTEESAGDTVATPNPDNGNDVGNVGNETQTTKQNVVDNETDTTKQNVVGNETETTKQNVVDNETSTTKQNSTDKSTDKSTAGTTKPQATTTKPQATTTKPQTTTTKQQTTSNNSNTETTKRELITSTGNATTKVVNIGYAYIELLSGSTVSIKTTTAKYIVSTRTDVSYTTKNGVDYKVSKLIITYNTGEERTLETVEEKCN